MGNHCPTHKRPLVCPSCAAATAGSATSKAKAKAARENGKRGGRPRQRDLVVAIARGLNTGR